jgi:hypothetical protein
MRISQQEIINAICLHVAERKQVAPTQVEVELMWDEEHGFTSEVTVYGRSQYLVESNMLEAMERYLLKEYDMRVYRDQIKLDVEEEMFADVIV